ncbi:hypothetical protein Tco_0594144 [Tanacetum coccineum]
MEFCTNLQTRVLDLEKTKTTQAEEIVSLKRRIKKLEQKKRSRTHRLKRINAIDADEDITMVNDQDDDDMFDVNTLTGDEVSAEQEVAMKDVNLTVNEVTLAQALAALKSVKPKVKAKVIEEPSVPVSAASTKDSVATTTTTTTTPRKGIVVTELGISTTTTIISSQPLQAKVQDKGKEKMIEPKKPLKKKYQISFDEQEAIRLQAAFDEEEILAREKDEANSKEESILQLKEQKRIGTKPPTKAQQKKTMIAYLKNIEGWKHKDLKSKDFDYIKELFGKAFKRVNMFVDYRTDLVKAEVDDDQEAAKIKELMKIIPDKEKVTIDAVLLATKPPTIINIKFRGGLLGLKAFLMLFGITTVLIDVNAAQSKLVLLDNFNENYSVFKTAGEVTTVINNSYLPKRKLLLLVRVKTARKT